MSENEVHPRVLLVRGLHTLAENRDVIKDTHGNLSARDGDTVYIKPSGVEYGTVTVDNVFACDVIGRHGGGPLRPSVDLPHHLYIYRNHPDVRAICHTHSPYATAFALAGRDIECCSTEQADYFGADVRCLPYADLYVWGQEVAEAREGDENAFLLYRHGALTFGKDPMEAVRRAVALENIAQKMWLAQGLRSMWNSNMPREEVRKWHDRYRSVYGQRDPQ